MPVECGDQSATYFHFSRWQPQDVKPGATHWTNWTRSAGWYGAHDAIELAAILRPEFAALAVLHHEGMRIQLADPDVLALSKSKAQIHKEQVFEVVRSTRFGTLPSRANCMYLCRSEAHARVYAARHGFSGYELYEVAPIEVDEATLREWAPGHPSTDINEILRLRRPQLHTANPRHLACHSAGEDGIREAAERYWDGVGTEGDELVEVLFRGVFRIIRHVGALAGSPH